MLGACVIIAAHSALAQAEFSPPFQFEPPPQLERGSVTRSVAGSTYSYTSTETDASLRLLITTMPVREITNSFGDLTAVQCINLFVGEVRNVHDDFFVVNQARPLSIAGTEFPQFRWTGKNLGRRLTGVLSCGRIQDWYLVIHFADETVNAARNFADIRARLRHMQVVAR